MNYILNIHTTSEKAIVNLCDGNVILDTLENDHSKEHAAFLHIGIQQILQRAGVSPKQLKAVGVTGGPGSYTGIRVGLATAKGLCFALKIPLMIFNTLELMAFSVIENTANKNAWFCPLIDARRMEVFTAVYDAHLNEVIPPSAMILDENSFANLLGTMPLYFFGSGAVKFKKLLNDNSSQAFFPPEVVSSEALAAFSWNKFQKSEFENLMISEPIYIKQFYTPIKK